MAHLVGSCWCSWHFALVYLVETTLALTSITSYTAPGPRGQKVDFLLGAALSAEPYALIQVTASMASPRTREREVGSLIAAMEATGIEEGTIVTLRGEERIETAAGPIEVAPAWKRFLQ